MGAGAVTTLAFASGALLAACGDDSSSPPPGPEYVLPPTPDAVILELRQAYTDLRLATIDSLLAPGYVFEFSPIDIDSFQIAPTWGRIEELRSLERMFTGEQGRWPTGELRAPLDTEFPLNPQLHPIEGSEWVEGPTGHFTRAYGIAMIINYVEGIDVVSGTQTFLVVDMAPRGGPGGETASGYAILGWHDGGLEPPPAPPVSTSGPSSSSGVASGAGGASPPSRSPSPPTVGSRALHAASWGYVKASFREIG